MVHYSTTDSNSARHTKGLTTGVLSWKQAAYIGRIVDAVTSIFLIGVRVAAAEAAPIVLIALCFTSSDGNPPFIQSNS